MKELMVSILAISCSTTAFAACGEISSAKLKEMSKEELATTYCQTNRLFVAEMQITTAKIKSGEPWSNDREQQCAHEQEKISREFKNRFPYEKLDCPEITAGN